MKLIIIRNVLGRFHLVDSEDVRTESVAILGHPAYVLGYEHGTDVEVDGYFVQTLKLERDAW